MNTAPAGVLLRAISPAAAQAILGGAAPQDIRVAADYPTEFSAGIAANVGGGSPFGPYFVHRITDDVVVGEIGGRFVAAATVEIGYAVVRSQWGRGYATDAARALLELAWADPAIERVVAHAPLDRPASGRVLAKVGFHLLGEVEDTHDGRPLRVQAWVARPPSAPAASTVPTRPSRSRGASESARSPAGRSMSRLPDDRPAGR